MTSQIPPEAIKAAEDVAKAELAMYGEVGQIAGHVAALVLDAAAPLIVAAAVARAKITERDRCAALAEQAGAVYCQRGSACTCRNLGSAPSITSFASLIRSTP